jgi:hypothetical protein
MFGDKIDITACGKMDWYENKTSRSLRITRAHFPRGQYGIVFGSRSTSLDLNGSAGIFFLISEHFHVAAPSLSSSKKFNKTDYHGRRTYKVVMNVAGCDGNNSFFRWQSIILCIFIGYVPVAFLTNSTIKCRIHLFDSRSTTMVSSTWSRTSYLPCI